MKLFGTAEQFDLQRVPFSRAGAFLNVYQEYTDGALYLNMCRSVQVINERPALVKLTPVIGGKELVYTYSCDEAKLTLTAPEGTAEFTYENSQTLRIRTNGIGLRFEWTPQENESVLLRSDSSIEAAFNFIGKLLFRGLTGQAVLTISEVNAVELLPDSDGTAELAIHEYYSNLATPELYKGFDVCVREMSAEFAAFSKRYPAVAPAYAEMAERAKWVVWHSQLGPRGALTSKVVYMQKIWFDRAFGWHHGFHAMAMRNDAKAAFTTLLAMFDYQNEYGIFPDNLSDRHQETWISSKPPIFGWSACYILDNFDLSGLTTADYRNIYEKLAGYTRYWYTHHDHAKLGVPQYYHIDESGYDESTLFDKGLPLVSPDLLAYATCLCEACAKLADKLSRRDDFGYWTSLAKHTLEYLVNELWDGEQFLAYAPLVGEKHKCGSVAQLQAVMLGHRLPSSVVKTLAKRLTDPDEFFSAYGVTGENLKSPDVRMLSFSRGPVMAPAQALICYGLYDGGEKDAAKLIAARYLNALNKEGLALAVNPYRFEPRDNSPVPEFKGGGSVTFPFSAWPASVYLMLAELLTAG
ncbi:MAG: hypothetical protein LBN97_06180 [Oscillospiraceae bacterium]|jgi:hypothetical protein|nr:hypothetical protein [Oscillospiraceae bacterium]